MDICRMLDYVLLGIHSFISFHILHLPVFHLVCLDNFLVILLRMVLGYTCHLGDGIQFILWWSLMHLLTESCRLVLVDYLPGGLLSFSSLVFLATFLYFLSIQNYICWHRILFLSHLCIYLIGLFDFLLLVFLLFDLVS